MHSFYNVNLLLCIIIIILGTTRSMTSETQEILKTRMCECCSATASMFGGKIDMDYQCKFLVLFMYLYCYIN